MAFTRYPHRPTWYNAPEAEIAKLKGLVSRSIKIGNRRTSIRVDAVALSALKEIAAREGLTLNELYSKIDQEKPKGLNFTVALRSYALQYFRDAATERGHAEAGHGKRR